MLREKIIQKTAQSKILIAVVESNFEHEIYQGLKALHKVEGGSYATYMVVICFNQIKFCINE